MTINNCKLFLPKWCGYRTVLYELSQDLPLHNEQFPKPIPHPPPQQCARIRCARNMQGLQLVLDFHQTPYRRYTSRTGGQPHPV